MNKNPNVKKDFWNDKKNIAIVVLSILLFFCILGLGSNNSNEVEELKEKISSLEASSSNLESENTKLKQEKENLETENQKLKESSNQPQQTTENTESEKVNSTAISVQSSEDNSEIVWVGETGKKYHVQGCRTLKGKGHQITLKQALSEGRQACKVCH